MKIVLEMNANLGITMEIEGMITEPVALGMIEYARTIIRADVVKNHIDSYAKAKKES